MAPPLQASAAPCIVELNRSVNIVCRARTATVAAVSKQDEIKIYGRHACRAVYNERPQQIIRGLITEKCTSEFTDVLKFMAEQHMAYRIVPQEELDRFCDAQHHEGICLVTRPRRTLPLEDILAEARGLDITTEINEEPLPP